MVKYLALQQSVRAVAEGQVDRTVLDGDGTDVIVDDLAGNRKARSGVVGRERLRGAPRGGDRRFGDIGQRHGSDDLITHDLRLQTRYGHGRKDREDTDDDQHLDRGEAAGHARSALMPAPGRCPR